MVKRFGYALVILAIACALAMAQDAAKKSETQPQPSQQTASNVSPYSGMYSFLKEGELVQVTVEDDGSVNGFISRYQNGDKGNFVDQFFKSGKIDGDKLSFSTKPVAGISFDFSGTVVRGEGKNPGDESYYVLDGTLTENVTDASKKTTSSSQPVKFKSFPK
jgi:hypothetical protein